MIGAATLSFISPISCGYFDNAARHKALRSANGSRRAFDLPILYFYGLNSSECDFTILKKRRKYQFDLSLLTQYQLHSA